tara:strand:- start:80 stop:388 length:309 start_codon:yes stop_codon:yes gene_type:complete
MINKTIIVAALLLVGCGEEVTKRNDIWDKAEMIDVKYYKSNTDIRYLQSFDMDGYKFVIYTNGHGSAIEAIPLNNDAEYIKLLEDETQLLGSMLAEYEIDHD